MRHNKRLIKTVEERGNYIELICTLHIRGGEEEILLIRYIDGREHWFVANIK
jgi:hypothetical protein